MNIQCKVCDLIAARTVPDEYNYVAGKEGVGTETFGATTVI